MMFGSKLDAQAMLATGMANRILPFSTFHADLLALLTQQLKDNDPGSILLTKKLVAGPLKEKRMKAVVEAQDVLADRFVDGAPEKRFKKKAEEMVARSKAKI